MEKREFVINKEQNRYELHVGDKIALAEYIINEKGVVCLTHIETPVELEGQGVASELTKKSLENIKMNGQKVNPICPFAVAYIKKHPEWESLVSK